MNVIRDYGFAAYLIGKQFKYNIKNNLIYFDITDKVQKVELNSYKNSELYEFDKIKRKLNLELHRPPSL